MRVLLIKPYNLSDHIQPSLGLGYLATSLRKKHDVKILDCIKENIRIEALPEYLRSFNPDVLGIQCYTFHLDFVKKAFRAAKKINDGIINIVGGPHPSAAPRETLNYFEGLADFAFQGEAELGLSLLLDRKPGEINNNLKDIPNLVWRDARRNIVINERNYQEDLDLLGFPAWDLIHPEKYGEAQHGAFFKKFPIAPIMITRGCPFSCTFCAGGLISGRKIRKRSVNHVLDEIKLLYEDYGIREFHIIDDNFTADREYAKEILARITQLNLDISIATPNGVRLDSLDEELLGLFKKAGLYIISLGIESGSERVLRLMKKNQSIAQIRQAIKMIRRAGIDIAGFFIIGFPQESIVEINDTINFSLELDLVRANYFTYLPFPGTQSYAELEKRGELLNVDWERFYFMSASYVPAGLTRKKLKNLQREAFMRFYIRPKILIKNMLSIKSPRHLYFLVKRFFHWIIMG